MAVRAGGGRERYYARSGPSTGTSSLVPAYPYPGSSLDAAFVANAYTWGRNSLDANFESTAAGAYFYQPSVAMPSYTNLPDFITGIGGTFTRASTATYFDNTGTLQTAASGVPRIGQLPGLTTRMGYLAEEARTNSIRNNSIIGVSAGTPGTLPTNWTYGQLSTLSTQIVGSSTENGITYVDIRLFGTATTTAIIYFETHTTIAATNAQTWCNSLFLKTVGGALTNIGSITTTLRMSDSGGSNLGFIPGSAITVPASGTNLSADRFSAVSTTSSASTAFVTPALAVAIAGAVDITLRIGLPQLELGAFATSPIPTTTVAVARAADVLSLPTTGWYSASAGTWFAESLSFDTVSAVQRIFSASDGSTNNYFETFFNSTSTLTTAQTAFGGVNRQLGGVGAQTPINVINKFATAANGAGISSAANGNTAITSAVAGTMPTLTTLYISNRADGARQFNGFLYRLFYIPSREADATLQALTA